MYLTLHFWCTFECVAGTGFFVRSTLYSNNRAISLTDFGGSNGPLMCLTSLRECCRSSDTGVAPLGNWIYPNGSIVPSRSSGNSLYRTRGPTAVLLHRDNNVVSISGVFTCEIPDSNNMNTVLNAFVFSGNIPGKFYYYVFNCTVGAKKVQLNSSGQLGILCAGATIKAANRAVPIRLETSPAAVVNH